MQLRGVVYHRAPASYTRNSPSAFLFYAFSSALPLPRFAQPQRDARESDDRCRDSTPAAPMQRKSAARREVLRHVATQECRQSAAAAVCDARCCLPDDARRAHCSFSAAMPIPYYAMLLPAILRRSFQYSARKRDMSIEQVYNMRYCSRTAYLRYARCSYFDFLCAPLRSTDIPLTSEQVAAASRGSRARYAERSKICYVEKMRRLIRKCPVRC